MNYAAVVNNWAARHNVPLLLARALVYHESGANPLAVGDRGPDGKSRAYGLTQIHRIAAEDIGRGADWDALQSVVAHGDVARAADLACDLGFSYLSHLIDRFEDFDIALMAYNQGPGVIGKADVYRTAVRKLEGTV